MGVFMKILGSLVGVLRLVFLFLHVLLGVFYGLVLFRLISWDTRTRMIRSWSRGLLRVIGVKLVLEYPPHHTPMRGMLVGNHSSWMDIFVANSVQAARFLAKSDIQNWPILGVLVHGAGTLFVQRGNRHSISHTNHEITQAALNGELVGLYPEGTTTDGTYMIPFRSNLLQPAVEAGLTIYPIAIAYRKNGAYTPLAAYAGDTSLLRSFWDLTCSFGVCACVRFAEPINGANFATRQELASATQAAIGRILGLEVVQPEVQAQVLTGV